MKRKVVMYGIVLALALMLPACAKSTNTTADAQTGVVNTPVNASNVLVISSTNAFVDTYGTYRVVGMVTNNSSNAITSIELTVGIQDASGNSLLKDDSGNITPGTTISTVLYTLAPGEASPFEYSYDTTNGIPSAYTVSITGQQTGTANRATLHSENVQFVDDGSGWFYLTGELVNTGSQWAHINALAGAVSDDSGNVLSADWTATYATELAPAGDASGRDRTPFEINFPNPGGSTKWSLYWDADVTDSVTDYPVQLELTNGYFDQYGSFHVVGWVTNQSGQSLTSLVVAGLYATDKKVVDASYGFVPVPMKPGVQAPFNISSFGSVDYNPGQASLVTAYSGQLDPWSTYPPSNASVDLAAEGEVVLKDGGTWTINGNVTNTSGRDLSGITVVVTVLNAENRLVAMEYTSISPSGDAIAAGEMNPYSVTVLLDPNVDASGFTTSTVVVGDVK